ncbi:MAG: helix-turn-helix domain-containing protein [Bacteroidales bacterium]|nr:helix-turn-helix domain-containing protein [Bacteroidales bacterium]
MRKCLFVVLLLLAGAHPRAMAQTFYSLRATQAQTVRGITQDPSGMLWIALGKSLMAYDGSSTRLFTDSLLTAAGAVNCCACSPDGLLLLGCERGLVTFDINARTFVADERLSGVNIHTMVNDGVVEWLGTDRGLYRNRQRVSGAESFEILAMELLDGTLYAGSYTGLFRFDPVHTRWLAVAEGQVPLVSCLQAVPARSQLCVGTAVSLMRYAPLHSEAPVPVASMPVVKCLCYNAQGHLLIGTDNGLFVRTEDGALKHILHDARDHRSIAGDAIWSLFSDRDHNIWVGTENGLSLLPNRQVVDIRSLSSITHSGDGNQLFVIHRDAHRRWWLGGTHGLICVDTLDGSAAKPKWYRMDDPVHPIPHNRIRAIYEDAVSGLWVGSDGGLLHYDETADQFRRVTIQGDKNQWVYDLQPVEGNTAGLVRVTTFNGVYELMLPAAPAPSLTPQRTLAQGAAAPQRSVEAVVQGHKWTLGSPVLLSDQFLSLYYDSVSHKIIYGGVDQLAIVDPDLYLQPRHRRPVVVTSVQVNGTTDVPLPRAAVVLDSASARLEELRLPYRHNNLLVSFSDFDFSPERTSTYAFRLSRQQTDWVYLPHGQNSLLLANLQPGHYEVFVCDASQIGTDADLQPLLRLCILPPWYMSFWAWVGYIFLFLILVAAITYAFYFRRRLLHERRRRELLLARAKQKAALLENDNEALQRQLRLQLLAEAESDGHLSADEQFLLRITKFVEENIDRSDLSVGSLSDLTATPSKQLSRRLRQLTGMTTVEFVRNLRLKKAAILLHNPNFTIAEVMYMVGFSNASYFTRSFVAEFKMTPTDYRNRAVTDSNPQT